MLRPRAGENKRRETAKGNQRTTKTTLPSLFFFKRLSQIGRELRPSVITETLFDEVLDESPKNMNYKA